MTPASIEFIIWEDRCINSSIIIQRNKANLNVESLDLTFYPLEGRDEQVERLKGGQTGNTLGWFLNSRVAIVLCPSYNFFSF